MSFYPMCNISQRINDTIEVQDQKDWSMVVLQGVCLLFSPKKKNYSQKNSTKFKINKNYIESLWPRNMHLACVLSILRAMIKADN